MWQYSVAAHQGRSRRSYEMATLAPAAQSPNAEAALAEAEENQNAHCRYLDSESHRVLSEVHRVRSCPTLRRSGEDPIATVWSRNRKPPSARLLSAYQSNRQARESAVPRSSMFSTSIWNIERAGGTLNRRCELELLSRVDCHETLRAQNKGGNPICSVQKQQLAQAFGLPTITLCSRLWRRFVGSFSHTRTASQPGSASAASPWRRE